MERMTPDTIDFNSLSKKQLVELVITKYNDCFRLEEENKKLKSEIENMKEVGRENIETLDRMSIELENYSKSFKRYRDFSKQELADSLYDAEEQNKSLKNELMEDMKTETKLNEEIKKLKSGLSLVIKERDDNIEQNKKLENKILKLGTRIYQNIDGEKREEYQEYCKRHKL